MDPASVFPDHYRAGQQDRIDAHWNLEHRLPVPRKPIVCGQCGGPMVLKQWWFHDRTKTGTSDPYRCSMEAKCVDCSWVAVYGVRIPKAMWQRRPSPEGPDRKWIYWRQAKQILTDDGLL